MPTHRNLIEDAIGVLAQGKELIRRLSPESYGAGSQRLSCSGVGPHVRHCLDCCQAFLDGVSTGRVDYDRRERDTRVEVDPQFALNRIEEVERGLRELKGVDLARELLVRMDSPETDPGAEADADWSRSSVGRELNFMLSHSIHHYAVIALILRDVGIEPGTEFGVAPSTLRHWKEVQKCAPLVG